MFQKSEMKFLNALPPLMQESEQPELAIEGFGINKLLLILHRTPKEFDEAQNIAVASIKSLYSNPNFRPGILSYCSAYELAQEQFSDFRNNERNMKICACWYIDMLDGIVMQQQKFVASIISHCVLNKKPGVITTTIPPNQWTNTFDKVMLIYMLKGYQA